MNFSLTPAAERFRLFCPQNSRRDAKILIFHLDKNEKPLYAVNQTGKDTAMEFIHAKRKQKGNKAQFVSMNAGEKTALSKDTEVVFKWVPVKGVRLSVAANKAVYEEYKEVRAQLLKDTVYNPDGTENKEGISRLRQAGLSDKAIYEVVGKGRTPNGYNYHHLFPRALSGSFANGPVQFGDEKVSSIHDWRCLQPLPNATRCDIHLNVHKAMEERNGPLPEPGTKTTYDIAMPLTAKEYEMYKINPKSVKAELLIVTADSYKTVDQRDNGGNSLAIAAARMKALQR